MFDADFYDWIMFTLHGNKDFEDGGTLGKVANFLTGGGRVSPRRNLLIVQFSNMNIANAASSAQKIAGMAEIAYLTTLISGGGGFFSSAATAAVAGGLAAAGGSSAPVALGPFQFAMRVPARAWLLHGCLPIRYKSGSDFDAMTSAISLQELEVMPEHVEEFSLGIKP